MHKYEIMKEMIMEISSIETDILVVGAGISGITTALEAAETGFTVTLIEKNPYIGGRVAQMNQYFPKLCPPTCGMEINIRRLRDNPRITLYTLAEVKSVSGDAGNYSVNVNVKPRYVNNKCTNCGDCATACTVERSNDFNFGMDKTKAIYLPYNNCYPMKYVLDKSLCSREELNLIIDSCKYNAIDVNEEDREININAKAIVWASGWDPYNASNLETLGYGKLQGVVTNMMLERLASASGPTGGKIQIPGSDKPIEKVAFVQCAGSRDENHLEYCSSVCCMASLKQAQYIREQLPETEIHVFYIDIRSPGPLEDFYTKMQNDSKVFFHRGKVAKVIQDPTSKQLIVEAEDTMAGELKQSSVDLVVLATGMQPTTSKNGFPVQPLLDENGFVRTDVDKSIIGCGVCTGPKEVSSVVQESTGAAMKAIHIVKGGN